MTHASPQRAEWMRNAAVNDGDVLSYRRLDDGRWHLEVRPTRLEHHRDPDSRGTLVLTTREVYAFTEGRWAGRQFMPTNRAGGT